MKRSILENPKTEKCTSINLGKKDGIITPYWRKRLLKLFCSFIPSYIRKEEQIWLTTPEEIVAFSQRIKNSNEDLCSVQYICITEPIADIYDIIDFFNLLREKTNPFVKIIYLNYNWLWSPLFGISSSVGFSRQRSLENFYRESDVDCFFDIAGWENFKKIKQYFLPAKIPVIGDFFDSFIVKLPLLRNLALITVFIARKSSDSQGQEYSTSVLIPCRNEEDNIEAVVRRMPDFGKSIELVFINDKSTDTTEEKILTYQKLFPEKNIVLVQGKGQGKGEAVREGMKYATGDICMILDADLTVIPEDLPQFYEAMKLRRADFLHGTRLVYPQEEEAMKFANIVGNIGFSIVFTYILDQRTTDTLCGTKVYWRKDWPIFEEMKSVLQNSDLWGDYNLIFGAARYGLKIAQLPVRYFERLEGTTKMNKRIRNGLIMLRVAWHALWKVKFISN